MSKCNREDKTCPLTPPCGTCVTASGPIIGGHDVDPPTEGNWDEIKAEVNEAAELALKSGPGLFKTFPMPEWASSVVSFEVPSGSSLAEEIEKALERDAKTLKELTGERHRFSDVFDALDLPQPAIPVDSQERKDTPIFSGVLAYFPRALAYVAKVSKAGNDKHNPGEPLHWSKGKSQDHEDCCARHLLDVGEIDIEDGLRHSGKFAWRALALLEMELEAEARGVTVSELKRMYREGEL